MCCCLYNSLINLGHVSPHSKPTVSAAAAALVVVVAAAVAAGVDVAAVLSAEISVAVLVVSTHYHEV